MDELISIVVPVYNCEPYVGQCIESILEQTYPNIELILVDDGSTDCGGEICDCYAESHRNVISLHQRNGGITRARLAGAEIARGEWITFVDADDWVKENFYETLYRESEGCDLVISGIIEGAGMPGSVECKPYYAAGTYDKREIRRQIIPAMLWNPELGVWSLEPSLCTKLFRRERIIEELRKAEKIGSNYGEDSIVLFPMIFKLERLKIVGESFYYHRARSQNVYPEYITDKDFFEKLHLVYQYLKDEFQQMGCWEMMQKQVDMFYINAVEYKRKSYGHLRYDDFISIFPFDEIKKDAKVVIYGAGKVGEGFMRQNEEYQFCEVVLWTDRNSEQFSMRRKGVENVDKISEMEFDYIVIAVDNYGMAKEIGRHLRQLGISKEKIIWRSTRKYSIGILD